MNDKFSSTLSHRISLLKPTATMREFIADLFYYMRARVLSFFFALGVIVGGFYGLKTLANDLDLGGRKVEDKKAVKGIPSVDGENAIDEDGNVIDIAKDAEAEGAGSNVERLLKKIEKEEATRAKNNKPTEEELREKELEELRRIDALKEEEKAKANEAELNKQRAEALKELEEFRRLKANSENDREVQGLPNVTEEDVSWDGLK